MTDHLENEMQDVTIYSTTWCPWCDRAKRLLDRKGIEWREVDVELDWNDHDRARLEKISGFKSVPQIFIGDTHVGGYDDLAKLENSGGLEPMVGSVQS